MPLAGGEVTQRPCRACSRRNRGSHPQAARRKMLRSIVQQMPLSAKQMRHRCNIDQQTIRRIKRAPRSPSHGPYGQLFQKDQITSKVRMSYAQLRVKRARISQHHPLARASFCRRWADCLDPWAMGCINDERIRLSRGRMKKVWRIGRNLRRCLIAPALPRAVLLPRAMDNPPTIERQLRQPERQDPPRRRTMDNSVLRRRRRWGYRRIGRLANRAAFTSILPLILPLILHKLNGGSATPQPSPPRYHWPHS